MLPLVEGLNQFSVSLLVSLWRCVLSLVHCAISFFRIKADESKEVYASGFCLDEECWRTYEEKVHSLLEQALGDRAKSIRVTWRSCPSQWKIEEVSDPALACVVFMLCDIIIFQMMSFYIWFLGLL